MARPKKEITEGVVTVSVQIDPEKRLKYEKVLNTFGNRTLDDYLKDKVNEALKEIETTLKSLL